jgi:hypothetical protein
MTLEASPTSSAAPLTREPSEAPELVGQMPRDVGLMLTEAAALLRRDLKTLFVSALPFCVGQVLAFEAASALMSSFSQAQAAQAAGKPAQLPLGSLGIGLLLLAVGFFIYQALHALIVKGTYEAFQSGTTTRLEGRIGEAFRRAPTLVGSYAVMGLWCGLLLFLPAGIVAGVLASVLSSKNIGGPEVVLVALIPIGLIALIGGVVLFVRWGMSGPVVVLEQKGAFAALKRSGVLMRSKGVPFFERSGVRLSVLLVVYFAIAMATQGLFSLPRLFLASLAGVEGNDFPPLFSFPAWFIGPVLTGQVLTAAVITPYYAVLLALFYLDLRVRHVDAAAA